MSMSLKDKDILGKFQMKRCYKKKKKENPDNEMEFLTSDWILSWRQENDPTVLGNAAHPQKKIMRGNTG